MKEFKFLDCIKVQNSSVEGQELSMFEKLGKDADKEVGNTDTPEAREKLRDLNEQIKNLEHAKGIAGVDKSNLQKQIDEMHKERAKVQTEIATGNGLDRAFKAMNKKV